MGYDCVPPYVNFAKSKSGCARAAVPLSVRFLNLASIATLTAVTGTATGLKRAVWAEYSPGGNTMRYIVFALALVSVAAAARHATVAGRGGVHVLPVR